MQKKVTMDIKEVPVLLLTGYLGSGKTTLLNRILSNRQNIRFAVIVNDIGEINIDANLIQRGGVVSQNDESLIALQNGCICCTLQTDLVEQVYELLKMNRFDYLVIEASGICDPEPIARTLCTIPQLGKGYTQYGISRLDCIATVVDALRMQDEFDGAGKLTRPNIGEEDIEGLLIRQIEFCDLILLNKASEINEHDRKRMHEILHTLQPEAEIIECDYADIPLEKLLHTHRFNFQHTASSAGWIRELGKHIEEEETGHQCQHEHGHCHHHHHEGGETEEYGISTFVYYRRRAFDLGKFDFMVASRWPQNIIRAKGVCYFSEDRDMTYLFEQAGSQKQISEVGHWYATLPEEQLAETFKREPGLLRDWDEQYGDRMQKIVFIGQHLDQEEITRMLDTCLE